MSLLPVDNVPVWAAHIVAGIVLGVCYFHTVGWSARRFASGGRATTAIAATIGRFVLLGGVLALASLQGAAPLLAMALGILIARSAVIGRVREAAP